MHSVNHRLRYLTLAACMMQPLAFAAPVDAPVPAETAAELPLAEQPRAQDIGPARGGLRGDSQRSAGKAVAEAGGGTGHKNLDLLLELQGRTAPVPTADPRDEASQGARPRQGQDRADSNALRTTPTSLLVPQSTLETGQAPAQGEPVVEGRRWSGNLASNVAAESAPAGESSGYKGDLYGVDFGNAPLRKMLLLLREYREWVIAAAVATVLLMLASGASTRRRNRR